MFPKLEVYFNGNNEEILKDLGALIVLLTCLVLIGLGHNGYIQATGLVAVGYYFRKRGEMYDRRRR